MKGYLQGMKEFILFFSQLIGVLRYFSCRQLPCGFDISVFTGLQLVSGALCLKVMYLSVF